MAVFAPMYPPAYLGGGPIKSVAAMVESSAKVAQIEVLTADRDLGQNSRLRVQTNEWVNQGDVRVNYAAVWRLPYWRALVTMARRRPRFVYLNSFWQLPLAFVPRLLAVIGWWRGAQLVIAVRGEFGEAALALHSGRKKCVLKAYTTLGLHRRPIWHASSEREAHDIRRVLGDSVRVCVSANQARLADADVGAVPESGQILRAAFVGRLVPIKGLDDVLRAAVLVPSPLILDIYGPEENIEYVAQCKKLAAAVPSHITVTFGGALPGNMVLETLAGYDLLIAPTHGENFSQVFAEALSMCVPVMARDVTPWTDVLHQGGGVVVRNESPIAWADSLTRYANLTPAERRATRQAAGQAFSAWSTVPADSLIKALLELDAA